MTLRAATLVTGLAAARITGAGLAGIAVIGAMAGTRAQSPVPQEEPGLNGYVLTSEAVPVDEGTVTLQSQGAEATTSIGNTGRFRIVPHGPGTHDAYVSAPGFTTQRMRVSVPSSKTFTLPPVRLTPASYLGVRFESPAGEPLTARVVRQSYDASGTRIWDPPGDRAADMPDANGLTRIGPLPRGVATFVLDAPPFARTRLPDVLVTGESALIDGGTIRVEPGARLYVDVVRAGGAPVAGHDVYLEDPRPFSPLFGSTARTDTAGRATFDRLASGRYRLRARGLGTCGNRMLTIARAVDVLGTGTIRTRLIIDGRTTLRLASAGVPLRAAQVWVTPEPAPAPPPSWLRGQSPLRRFAPGPLGPPLDTPCSGSTDADGRVMFSNMPPGPARVEVRLPHAIWVRRAELAADGREVVLDIPSGFMALRVVNALTRVPVSGAALTWTSGGARVEAMVSASGDTLLDGVAAAPGILAVRAAGYVPLELKFRAPPDVLHDIALEPARDTSPQCRVLSEAGEPIAHAVVELTPGDPIAVPQVATTDGKGWVRFVEVSPGSIRVRAGAPGFVASAIAVPARTSGDITLTLAKGYRIEVLIEKLKAGGTATVRVMNAAGIDMDHLLDAGSDRVARSERLSLGPLPRGQYVVQLHGAGGRQDERVRLQGADARVTFR